jgi:hypothetical protein
VTPPDLEHLPLAELPSWLVEQPGEVHGATLDAAHVALDVSAREGKGEAPKLLEGAEVTEKLAAELRMALPTLGAAVAEHGSVGMAGWLDDLGEMASGAANATRTNGEGLTVGRALRRLAYALWSARVLPRLKKETHSKWPGIPLPLVDRARVGTWGKPRAVDVPEHGRVLEDGAGTTLATLEPGRVPAVPANLLEKMEVWERAGAPLLGTLHAHRLLRWLAWEAHTQHTPGHVPILEVRGGWTALALAVGCPPASKSAPAHLRNIVFCLDAHRFAFPDNTVGRLLTLDRYAPPNGPGSPSIVRLLPGAPLRPHFIFGLRRADWKVVPVLSDLPPMVGREREHGALAELHWRVLVEMRRRCSEMVGSARGVDLGLYLPPSNWAKLADMARVPRSKLPIVLERWTRDGRDGPAFLRIVGPDRYTLGTEHDDARRVLLECGWKEARGSERGKRSARARGGAGPKRRRKAGR